MEAHTARVSIFHIILVAGLFVSTAAGWTCDTPVYAHALTEWDATPYQAVVFYRDRLDPADQHRVSALQTALFDRHANITVTTVNLAATPTTQEQQLYAAQPSPSLPWVAIYYPIRRNAYAGMDVCALPENERRLYWAGSCDALALGALLDSPARRDIARHLCEQDTLVWILLESGHRRKDAAAAHVLQTALPPIMKTLTVSVPQGAEPATPPTMRAAVVRIAHDNPREQWLIRMLLNSESEIAALDEPLVFPVYGRGNLLYTLAGAGISPANLREAAEFLVGPCTCELKMNNLGVELLLAWDWTNAPLPAEAPPMATGLGGFAETAVTAAPPASHLRTSSPPTKPSQTRPAPTPLPTPAAPPAKSLAPPAVPAPRSTPSPAVIPVPPPSSAASPPFSPLARNLLLLAALFVGAISLALLTMRIRRQRNTRRPV